MIDDIEKVNNLYAMICGQKITDGELGARIVFDTEELVGRKFRNTQEFHYYVADFLKRKQVVNETAGRKFRRYRRKEKITQVDAATMFGVDRRTIVRWENNEQMPSKEALKWVESLNGSSPDNVTFDESAG